MRIAQVVSAYHPHIGGVETVAQRLAQGCAEAGDQVTVLTHQLDDSPTEEYVGSIRVLRFPLTIAASNYPASIGLFRYLKAHAPDYDLVHAHSYHSIVGHAAIRSQLPLVFTPHYHGTGHSRFRAILHHVYRSIGSRQFRLADAVICVSDAERRLVLQHFPWTAAKLKTIPLGTDIIRPTVTVEMPDLAQPTVLVVGRIERYKNIDLIIDAFRRLSFPASLVIVGEGPERGRLQDYASASAPDKQIIFTGRISDEMLQNIYGQASLLVSASDHEAFGLVVTEGLSSGTRVLASAIPAHTELAEMAGADAPITIVDVRDSKLFAQQMEHLLLAGRIINEKFQLPSWADFVQNVRELYLQITAATATTCDATPENSPAPHSRLTSVQPTTRGSA